LSSVDPPQLRLTRREGVGPERGRIDDLGDHRYLDNQVGGELGQRPNGLDFWWDEQGDGNCWDGNTSPAGAVTSDPIEVPACAHPSGDTANSQLGNPEKVLWLLGCLQDAFAPSCGFAVTPSRPASG
jgi:hypothetical protein